MDTKVTLTNNVGNRSTKPVTRKSLKTDNANGLEITKSIMAKGK